MINLVKRSMVGDADAFLELMEQNSLSMYKVARGILNNDEDVADAIQDTILTCFEKMNTLKKPEYFKTWMIRILINECNKILRHYRGINIREEMPEISDSDKSLAEFEFKEMLELVEEKYRVVLILYYVEGFKIADIAEILKLNESTVKTRLTRARSHIRQVYADGEDTRIKNEHVSENSRIKNKNVSADTRIKNKPVSKEQKGMIL
ncbi:sigma-70 family RNA polymerase sigma factor [Blautia schinkii]|nr:sigma-70 family RNA polymerase sigma factor [Blautia schinkii]